VCVYIPTFWREQGRYFIKVLQFLNEKNPRDWIVTIIIIKMLVFRIL